MYYLLLLLATLLGAVDFSFEKKYQSYVKNNILSALVKLSAISLITALLFWAINGFTFSFSSFTVILSLILAVVTSVSGCVSFFGYANGSIAIFTLFQMSGGMLLPFIYGIIIGNEVTAFPIIGIVLMLVSLALPLLGNRGHFRNMSLKFILLCVTVFFLNGFTSILSYIYTNNAQSSGNINMVLLKSLFTIAIAIVLYVVFRFTIHRNDDSAKTKFDIKSFSLLAVLLIIVSATGNISYLLQLTSAGHLPAVAAYPIITGGIIVFTSLAGIIFFKEKLSKFALAGIILTFLSTFLFIF